MREAIDQIIDEALEAGRIVGTVVLVARHGTAAYARAAGFADRENGVPVEADTVFRWASLTKPVVAVTALALVERGLLDLDDPVTRFLPDFTPRTTDGRTPEIRLRHLLTHTSGLGYPGPETDDPYRAAQVSTGLDQPGVSLAENLRRIVSAPLYFSPGSAWRYGVSLDVLGAVIAAVHGGSLADAVAGYVTGPLGMADSGFVVSDPARLAVAYANGPSGAMRMGEPQAVDDLVFSPARAFDEQSFQSGGAGMVGTAGDFLKLLETLRSGGSPILSSDTVELAFRDHVGALRSAAEPGLGFGFLSGVIVDPARAGAPTRPGALSWGGVYGHSWILDPATDLSIVVATNTAPEGCNGEFPAAVTEAAYTS